MEQFREYDDEAARAGAPVGCRGQGFVPHVLKRAHGRIFGTVTLPSGVEEAQDWRQDGQPASILHGVSPRDLVMVPIDYIEGKPVWHGDIVYQGRRRIAINAEQSEAVTGLAAPWLGATIEPRGEMPTETLPPLGVRVVSVQMRMEQAAAAMQAECVRQVMGLRGWTGTRDAADVLRKIDVSEVVRQTVRQG